MKDYVSDAWSQVAAFNGLDSFQAIWDLDIGWFEEPNRRRGGWSGVSRREIRLPGGGTEGIFIKRQQNHNTRSWKHPFSGVTTFRREFDNLERLQAVDVPTLEVLYFAERTRGGDRCAILVSRELAGYSSLDDCVTYWNAKGYPERPVWKALIDRLAGIARNMHAHHYQQNCFLTKHIFIGERHGEMDIRLIDFEKAKRRLSVRRAMLRDLDTLNRRSPGFRTTDRLRFLLAYLGKDRVDGEVRKIWNRLLVLKDKKSHTKV